MPESSWELLFTRALAAIKGGWNAPHIVFAIHQSGVLTGKPCQNLEQYHESAHGSSRPARGG